MTKVAVLGATGMVGQRFVQLLENHPWFETVCLAASDASKGKQYGPAGNWVLDTEMPEFAGGMAVSGCTAKEVADSGAELAFSALPSDVALRVEKELAAAGIGVVSKAAAHRMDADVPLLIPEVNPEHIGLIEAQRQNRNWAGFISSDPNCSTCQLALALKPLQQFGPQQIIVTTMQAVSGAGFPGVPSLAIQNNAIPFINGEEEKMEMELAKMLGTLENGAVRHANMEVIASCNRVNTQEGHLESVAIEFADRPSLADIAQALEQFRGAPQQLGLPTAPTQPIVVRAEPDRPQPRKDWSAGNGMSVTVGRLRQKGSYTLFSCLASNTIRGAAGNGILHAELLHKRGYI
ncbi:MAG: aspartate-semialdehyde dehydrogenase [Candidatus Aenigmarchaeota archaeon]|nr:aspartate-semialdehyde dehydrogenase [Candidatus Aenigmarchaeota archaeon]